MLYGNPAGTKIRALVPSLAGSPAQVPAKVVFPSNHFLTGT